MTIYSSTATANGTAYTSVGPPSLVTSTASATATSSKSEDDAKEEASKIATQVANSVASNNANIINQTLTLSSASVRGAFVIFNTKFFIQPYTFLSNDTQYLGPFLSGPSLSTNFTKNIYDVDNNIIGKITGQLNGIYDPTERIINGTRQNILEFKQNDKTYNLILHTVFKMKLINNLITNSNPDISPTGITNFTTNNIESDHALYTTILGLVKVYDTISDKFSFFSNVIFKRNTFGPLGERMLSFEKSNLVEMF